jgi:predicted metalloendopeptidase
VKIGSVPLHAGSRRIDHAEHFPRPLEGKVGAFYKAFLDSAHADAQGAAPLAPLFDAVRAAKTRGDLAALIGRSNEDFEGTLFGVATDADVKDPTRYAVYVGQAGLGLPDRDYYSQASFAEKKTKYEAYVAQMLGLCGWPDPAARAKDIVAFETAVAAASWPKAQQRDPNATYNPMSIAELAKFAPGFEWRPFLAAARVDRLDHVVVAEKSAFPKLAAIWAQTPTAEITGTVSDSTNAVVSGATVTITNLGTNGTMLSVRVSSLWTSRWRNSFGLPSGCAWTFARSSSICRTIQFLGSPAPPWVP